MSTTYTATPRTTSIGSLIRPVLAPAALAAVATPTVAAAGLAAGISLDVGGAPIPVQGSPC